MPIFAVDFDIDKAKEIEPYLEATNENLKSSDMVRNPFTGKVTIRENTAIIDMTPMYPNPLWIGAVALIPVIVFGGFRLSFWLLLPGFFLIATVPHTTWFVYKMFKKGAKRKGYTGSLKRIGKDEIIKRYI
jgi:hypothetical protein